MPLLNTTQNFMRLAATVLCTMLAATQGPSAPDVFARARDATWAVSVLRYATAGQVEYAAFVGSGFFVSRNHFITGARGERYAAGTHAEYA